MAVSGDRLSTYTSTSTGLDHERPKSGDSSRRNMWSSMLDGVASGKRLPEKNILVLGGSGDSQKEFIESLSSAPTIKRQPDRTFSKQAPLANDFALGYTYYDVLDADQEDTLARLSLYLLADASPAFTPLLRPLLTPQTIPNTLIVILLDWSQPWLWLRQLRGWIRLLRPLLVSLDEACKSRMEEVMISWRDRGRGTTSLDGSGSSPSESDVVLPLGPGEWEEALGLPLCVVCQNSDKMEILEREKAWKEEEFDFVLQFLRTTLLKHGGSLIYTTPTVTGSLQTLIHASLSIQSLLKKQPLKPNVIDRDKVLVPPNWDSWGKIRVLREGFDVEGVNRGWSLDIQEPSLSSSNSSVNEASTSENGSATASALAVYEETIVSPTTNPLQVSSLASSSPILDVTSQDSQLFLASQLESLERLRTATETKSSGGQREGFNRVTNIGSDLVSVEDGNGLDDGRVNEHIGPVQFNMGGIQVDADDMLRRLKDRQSNATPDPETPSVGSPGGGKSQNEQLASYFAGLMNRASTGNTSSPRSNGL